MGFDAQFANEYEWFNFRETPTSLAEKKYREPQPLTPGMFGYSLTRLSLHHEYVNDLLQQLPAFGVPLEGLHTETGTGVYEAAIEHTDVLEAADRAILFKTAVKEIAYRHQILPVSWQNGMRICQVAVDTFIKAFGATKKMFFTVKKGVAKYWNTTSQVSYIVCLIYCRFSRRPSIVTSDW